MSCCRSDTAVRHHRGSQYFDTCRQIVPPVLSVVQWTNLVTMHLNVILCPISVATSLDPAVLMLLPLTSLVCETMLWSPMTRRYVPSMGITNEHRQLVPRTWCLFPSPMLFFIGLTIGKFEPIASCRSQSFVKMIADWKTISKLASHCERQLKIGVFAIPGE